MWSYFLGSQLPKAVGCLGGAVYVLMELAGGNGSQDTTAALDKDKLNTDDMVNN